METGRTGAYRTCCEAIRGANSDPVMRGAKSGTCYEGARGINSGTCDKDANGMDSDAGTEGR